MQYENYNCVIRYLSYILQNLAHIFRLRCVLLAHRFTIKFSVNAKGVFQIESNVIEILHVVFLLQYPLCYLSPDILQSQCNHILLLDVKAFHSYSLCRVG
jgi:hypothetical protein